MREKTRTRSVGEGAGEEETNVWVVRRNLHSINTDAWGNYRVIHETMALQYRFQPCTHTLCGLAALDFEARENCFYGPSIDGADDATVG